MITLLDGLIWTCATGDNKRATKRRTRAHASNCQNPKEYVNHTHGTRNTMKSTRRTRELAAHTERSRTKKRSASAPPPACDMTPTSLPRAHLPLAPLLSVADGLQRISEDGHAHHACKYM